MKNENPRILAYIGDAVHTLYVRKYFIKSLDTTPAKYHQICSKFCSAKTQSVALDKLMPILTEEEAELVRRTRNTKCHDAPKNTELADYKKATCLEALIGWHYLNENNKRLEEILANCACNENENGE